MKSRAEMKALLNRYVAGECTEEEIVWVETWYNQQKTELFTDLSEGDIESDLQEVFQKLEKQKLVKWYTKYRVAAAAVLIIGLGIGLYTYNPSVNLTNLNSEYSSNVNDAAVDIAPGGNKATLTLADGTAIFLDDVSDGQIAQQDGLTIDKNEDGLVTYTIRGNEPELSNEVVFNTISTPKGGQYQVVLSDGTKVWLNAASTLKFPTTFCWERTLSGING